MYLLSFIRRPDVKSAFLKYDYFYVLHYDKFLNFRCKTEQSLRFCSIIYTVLVNDLQFFIKALLLILRQIIHIVNK